MASTGVWWQLLASSGVAAKCGSGVHGRVATAIGVHWRDYKVLKWRLQARSDS